MILHTHLLSTVADVFTDQMGERNTTSPWPVERFMKIEQRKTFPRCSLLPEWAVIRCGGSALEWKVDKGVSNDH